MSISVPRAAALGIREPNRLFGDEFHKVSLVQQHSGFENPIAYSAMSSVRYEEGNFDIKERKVIES